MPSQTKDIDFAYALLPYRLVSFLGGQSEYEDKGIAGSYKNSQNLSIRKRVDSLSCNQALTDDLAPGTMTAISRWQVVADDGNIYHFCADGKIFSRHPDGTYHLVYTDSTGNIIGAEEWYDNAGNTYLLWATSTTLSVKLIIGTTTPYTNSEPWTDVNNVPTGTWPKTNLTAAPWHTMRICVGTLQIANSNTLAFVGYDFSYTNNALQLIPGNVAATLIERSIYTIVAANMSVGSQQMDLYAWDGVSLDYNNKQVFRVRGVNAMIDTEYALMQVGTNGNLFISDFNNQMPLYQFYGGGQCNPDGVTGFEGLALFGVYGNSSIEGQQNGVWSFGRITKNANPVLNCEYQLDCDEVGSVTSLGNDIFVTYQNGTEFGVKHLDPNNLAPAIYQSLDLVTPMGTRRYPIPLDRMLYWSQIRLIGAPLPEGCSVEVFYRLEKTKNTTLNPNANPTTGWIQADTMDSVTGEIVTAETTTNRMDIRFKVGEKARVLEVMVVLTPNGNLTPEIYEVDVYFQVG